VRAETATDGAHIPGFVPPQLARLVDAPPSGPTWVHEVKYDGYRMQLRVEDGKARLSTRKGLDWTAKFPEIAADGARLSDCMLDGEICALDRDGRSDFAALQDAISTGKTAALAYFVFDCLFDANDDLRRLPLDERKAHLKRLRARFAKRSRRILLSTEFSGTGSTVLKAACKLGLEGVVSKRRTAPYVSTRADSWLKAKCRGGQEVVIGGWRGAPDKLRSLLVGTFDKGALVYRGKVGTGYKADVAADVLAKLRLLRQKNAPFRNPPRGTDILWVKPTLVGEIEYETVTTDGLFRQAAFKGLRVDKPARNVVLERASKTK
jgi:bifunctional non-homologous end joining protein LigD